MEALLGLFIFIGLAALAAVALARYISKSNAAAKPQIDLGRPLPLNAGGSPAFTRRNDFFSASESSFYEILCRLCPEHTVFAKVRLADLVRVQASGREFWQRFNSICGKHVDFVVCDEQLAPVVAIELDDSSHREAERLKRDKFVDSVLQTASLPIVHVPAKRGYVLDEIRQLLAPHLRINSANVSESADASYVPANSWRPSV